MIIAATSVESDLIHPDYIGIMIQSSLSCLKLESNNKIYSKMAAKTLVKLVSTNGVQAEFKEQIISKVIEFIKSKPNGEDLVQYGFKSNKKLKHYDKQIDSIPSYYGVSAFFNNFGDKFGFENILIANEGIVLKTLKKEFQQIPRDSKLILKHDENNHFYSFIIRLRTLFNIWRDINTRMMIHDLSEIIQLLIDFILELMENDSDTLLEFQEKEESKITENTIPDEKRINLSTVSKILGEALAKNIVSRKKFFEFLFKIIDVDQPDQVIKDIGRETISYSLEFAENDDSVNFFKFLPYFIIPSLKNSSKNKQFSVLMARLFKLLPLNKAGVFDAKFETEED